MYTRNRIPFFHASTLFLKALRRRRPLEQDCVSSCSHFRRNHHCIFYFVKSFHIHDIIYSSHQPVRQTIGISFTGKGNKSQRGCTICLRTHSSRVGMPGLIPMSYGPKSRLFSTTSKQPPYQNDLVNDVAG